MRRRLGIALSLAAISLAATTSCTSSRTYDDCDYVVRQCGTVCQTWCDDWGCYPACWDQCWNVCGTYPAATVSPPPGGGARDAGATDAGASDAASDARDAGGGDGGGALCSSCTSNEACGQGALCIRRGGDAGTSFCSEPCPAGDCPQGFTCAEIGGGKQCLPNAGSCP